MTTEQLIQLFVTLSLKSDDALFDRDSRTGNRLIQQIWKVEDELKSRPGDQRKKLAGLFKHPNPEVRLQAANATLALVPKAARAVLEQLASVHGPQQIFAGMTLKNIDSGFYKPT